MERNLYLDQLKLVLAVCVIALHCQVFSSYSPLLNQLTLNGLFRMAVPIFLIINGYYFHSAHQSQRAAIWLKRLFLLYAFWMVVYSYAWANVEQWSLPQVGRLLFFMLIGHHHLWYIAGTLGAAVMFLAVAYLSTKWLIVLVLGSYLVGSVIMYCGNYHLLEHFPQIDHFFNMDWVHRNLALLCFPFFTMGYLIKKHGLIERIEMSMLLRGTLLGIACLGAESLLNVYIAGEGGFDNMLSLLLICPMLFMLVAKHVRHTRQNWISRFSSGLYFIHILFVDYFSSHFNLESLELFIVVLGSSIVGALLLLALPRRLNFIL